MMSLSILPLVMAADALFIRAPGHEEENTLYPGERSLAVLVEGTGNLLNSGFVTLLVLPTLAGLLYLSGYRVAGPMLALFAAGLFLARMLGTPA
jgi:hypothetical protein